jgi:hypothetical protein
MGRKEKGKKMDGRERKRDMGAGDDGNHGIERKVHFHKSWIRVDRDRVQRITDEARLTTD